MQKMVWPNSLPYTEDEEKDSGMWIAMRVLQFLSPERVQRWPGRHHSFPASGRTMFLDEKVENEV